MAGISETEAQEQLDAWLAASKATAKNQSYKIDGRELTRADAKEIRESVDFWNRQVMQIARGNPVTARAGTPVS